MVNLLISALAVFLTGSVLLFLKATTLNKRKKQWAGFAMALIAVPLFVFYYNDRVPFQRYRLRWLMDPVGQLGNGNPDFASSLIPAYIIGGLYFVRVVVYLRMIVKSRRDEVNENMRRVNDKVGNFFAYTTAAILLGAIPVSAYSLGWVGAASIGGFFALIYVGIIGIFADTLELTAATSALGSVWLRRRLLWVFTTITKPFARIAALYRAIRPSLRKAIERMKEATKKQREGLQQDVEKGNDGIIRAGLRPGDTRDFPKGPPAS